MTKYLYVTYSSDHLLIYIDYCSVFPLADRLMWSFVVTSPTILPTRTICSFIDCCLRNTPAHTVLVVVPVNVLQNWLNEFDMWVPADYMDEETRASSRNYSIYVINDMLKTFQSRASLIKKWHETGGVMILGWVKLKSWRLYPIFYPGASRQTALWVMRK